MGAQLKRLVLIAALVLALGVVVAHLVFNWLHYLAGAGSLSYRWIFVVKPLIAGFSVVGVIVGARRWVRAHTPQIQLGVLLALSIAAGLGVFVFGPLSTTGAKCFCEGLAQRIRGNGLVKLMNQHVQGLVRANPNNQTEERYEDVTQQAPPWIRENFSGKTLVVEFLNGMTTHV